MIEKLTDEESELLSETGEGAKALHIMADQAAQIGQLSELAERRHEDGCFKSGLRASEACPECNLGVTFESAAAPAPEHPAQLKDSLRGLHAEAAALRVENADLHSRVADLEAVLDQESRAKLEAMAAVERLSSAPPQPHVTQLRLRAQLDADQS